MSKFYLRLKELRTLKKYTQQELADYLKISKSSVNMYERGEREPGLDLLEAIADFFNVDLDYLMGKSDNPQKYLIHQAPDMPLTSDEKHLLDCYRGFNEEGRQEALKRLSEMALLDRYKKRSEETNPIIIEHHKTHLLVAGKGGSADVEIADPEGLDEEVEKLKRKHNIK